MKLVEMMFGFLLLVLASAVFVCAVPSSPHTFGGAVYINGVLLNSGDTDYVISFEVDGVELVRYTMGDYPSYDGYNLIVPMDTDCSVYGAACEGDDGYIYVGGMPINGNPVMVGASAGYTLADIFVEYEEPLFVDVVPLNVDIAPVGVVYAVVSVTPAGVYNLTIDGMICKDTGGGCEYLDNPSGEISVVFEDTEGLVAMTDSTGKAVIRVETAAGESTSGTIYIYSVRAEDGEWIDAMVTVRMGEIPEFPVVFLPVLLTFLVLSMGKRFS